MSILHSDTANAPAISQEAYLLLQRTASDMAASFDELILSIASKSASEQGKASVSADDVLKAMDQTAKALLLLISSPDMPAAPKPKLIEILKSLEISAAGSQGFRHPQTVGLDRQVFFPTDALEIDLNSNPSTPNVGRRTRPIRKLPSID